MSKELTTNQTIAKLLAKMNEKEIEEYLNSVDKLEEILDAPPTEQEVCKELSEYLKRDVKYDGENFYYLEVKQYYGECDEIICGWSYSPKELSFEMDLPPT